MAGANHDISGVRRLYSFNLLKFVLRILDVAVETVYMIKVYTIVRSTKTMKKLDMALKVQATYKELINSIPTSRFTDFGLKDKMLQGYFRANKQSCRVVDESEGLSPKGQGHVNEIEGNWYSSS